MTRRLAVPAVLLGAALLSGCVPQLPSGYHVDASTGQRTANSDDQVKKGIEQLARTTPADRVLAVELPNELISVPVPENAIARRYDRKQRKAEFCAAWKLVGDAIIQTPSLDDTDDLAKDASLAYTALHSIDPQERYIDLSVRTKRGETRKRRLPVEIKAALPELEAVRHAWYARVLFLKELDDAGKLTDESRHELVQRALDEVTGPEATALTNTVNDFFIVHCLGGTA